MIIFSSPSTRHSSSGFTLLEVLIVLAILLLGMMVLSPLMRGALDQAVEAEEKTSVQVICQNALNEILAGGRTITDGMEETIPDFENWRLSLHLSPAPLENLIRVSVVAQKYEDAERIGDRPGVFVVESLPVVGQRLILSQIARQAQLRVVAPTSASTSAQNRFPETDFSVPGGGMVARNFAASPNIDPFAASGFAPTDSVLPPVTGALGAGALGAGTLGTGTSGEAPPLAGGFDASRPGTGTLNTATPALPNAAPSPSDSTVLPENSAAERLPAAIEPSAENPAEPVVDPVSSSLLSRARQRFLSSGGSGPPPTSTVSTPTPAVSTPTPTEGTP